MRYTVCIISFFLLAVTGECQETVFELLKSELRLADSYFENKDYHNALELYSHIAKRNPSREVELKIARAHHLLKQYDKAVSAYEKHALTNSLPVKDLYYYAEAQSGISNYGQALKSYQNYHSRVPNDPLIVKKIWRLNNIQYLFEDSMHYAVRPVEFNSGDGELCAVPFRNGVVFMSNRREIQPIEKVDASRHSPFYKVYFSKTKRDSINAGNLHYETPLIFNREFSSGFHAGPIAFYDDTRRMVFASTGQKTGNDGSRSLQLYFAQNIDDGWKISYPFPFNNDNYSLSDPWISEDGKILYFSSDMKGGYGGKDIYRSELVNNHWTKPTNLGDVINTPYDEVYPYRYKNTLYFSSTGHPGLGGLDIFKAESGTDDFTEPQNLGYPLNTNYDDFGIVITPAGNEGYFSSNRRTGGYNDDVYEFEMDLQTYPLELRGVMKFKEHNLSDSADVHIMPNAQVSLIDNERNLTVFQNTCDASGNFRIVIPYYGKYKLRVIGEDKDENIVSLEIPKFKKEHGNHEIVVVKDLFKKK
jgi:tetratricopeptide (TPR) repeat protein